MDKGRIFRAVCFGTVIFCFLMYCGLLLINKINSVFSLADIFPLLFSVMFLMGLVSCVLMTYQIVPSYQKSFYYKIDLTAELVTIIVMIAVLLYLLKTGSPSVKELLLTGISF